MTAAVYQFYTVVGDNGSIFTSLDRTVWTQRHIADETHDQLAIAYGNNIFCSVGNGSAPSTNRVVKSTDGTTYIAQNFPVFVSACAGIAFSPTLNLFVAGGDSVTFLKSVDCSAWIQTHVSTGGAAQILTRLIWGKDRFAGVTDDGKVYYSLTGESGDWNVVPVAAYLSGIAYNPDDDSFMVVGNAGLALISYDGCQTWAPTSVAGTGHFTDCGYSAATGYYACVGFGGAVKEGIYQYVVATDTWTKRFTNPAGFNILFCYGGTTEEGVAYCGGASSIFYNDSPTSWVKQDVDIPTTFYGMVIAEFEVPRPPTLLAPRAVGHYPYIDPRSFIDSDKPK